MHRFSGLLATSQDCVASASNTLIIGSFCWPEKLKKRDLLRGSEIYWKSAAHNAFFHSSLKAFLVLFN